MSVETDVKALLEADATLMALLTGGVYAWETVGAEGITRTTMAAAFDAANRILPCAVVKARPEIERRAVFDPVVQSSSWRQTIEVWLYEFIGYTTIEAAATRIYALLQAAKGLGGHVRWVGVLRGLPRDKSVDAAVMRVDFTYTAVKTV